MFGIFKRQKNTKEMATARRDFQLLKRYFGDNVKVDNTLLTVRMEYKYQGLNFNRLYIEYKDGEVTFIDGRGRKMCSSNERLKVEELLCLMKKEGVYRPELKI